MKKFIVFKSLIQDFSLIIQPQMFEEYEAGLATARFFIIIIRHKEVKQVSDSNEITEIKVIKSQYLIWKIF